MHSILLLRQLDLHQAGHLRADSKDESWRPQCQRDSLVAARAWTPDWNQWGAICTRAHRLYTGSVRLDNLLGPCVALLLSLHRCSWSRIARTSDQNEWIACVPFSSLRPCDSLDRSRDSLHGVSYRCTSPPRWTSHSRADCANLCHLWHHVLPMQILWSSTSQVHGA